MPPASAPEPGHGGPSARVRLAAVRIAPALVLALPTLLVATDAWARVGGGQGYSGGGSSGGGSSGGGYGGGGGGGDGGALIELLIWLCIRHPAIGIPLTLFVVAVVIYSKVQHPDRGFRSHHRPSPGMPPGPTTAAPPPRAAAADLRALLEEDPNFSEPLAVDFVQLVYARVQQARGDGDLEPLRPLVADKIREGLAAQRGNLSEVKDVIFGSTRLVTVRRGPSRMHLLVELETNLTEVRAGRESQLLRQERWTFGRDKGVLSPGPERMRSLSCPSCGATLDLRPDGRCPSCETVRTGGASQWQVEEIQVLQSRALAAPELHLGGGVEPGTRLPTRTAPDLPVQARALTTRHPGFSWEQFNKTVEVVFHKLQQAWSDQRWELARPLETDALFQTHRFWMERYRRHGLVNKLDKVAVRRIEPAKIGKDAFYESITVRVFASMMDWTERTADGKVVAGSKDQPRVFSEYWTFIRRIGGSARPEADTWDAEHCPSCGAPLDKVSQAGVCGYCEAKISNGDFDWVLTRIEQDEAYKG